MKKLLIGLLIIGTVVIIAFGVPNSIQYKGRLMEDGVLVNGTKTLHFSIYETITDGSAIWSTSNVEINVIEGVYSVVLGPITPGVLVGDNAYLQITVGNEVLLPRMKINSVGYALQAGAVTGESNVFTSDGNVGVGTTAPANTLHVVNNSTVPVRVERSSSSPAGSTQLVLVNPDTTDSNSIRLSFDSIDSAQTEFRAADIRTDVLSHTSGSASADISIWTMNGGANPNERMRITAAGNVGIGTSVPNTKLEVAGTVSANAFHGDGSGLTNLAGVSAAYGADASAGTSSPNAIYIDSNGRIGVGTTTPNPAVRMQVKGILFSETQLKGPKVLVEATDAKLSLSDGAGSIHMKMDSSGNLDFMRSAELTSNIRVQQNGNVGIGTTSPAKKLDVYDTVRSSRSDAPSTYLQMFGGNSGRDPGLDWGSAASTNFSVRYNDNVLFRMSANGNVGIGDDTPTTRLEVAGTVSANAFSGDGSALTNIPGASTAYGAAAGAETNSPNAVFVGITGNVGIGTTAPEDKLNVQGGSLQVGSNAGYYSTLEVNDLKFHRDNSSYISQMGAGGLVFTTNGGSESTRMVITASGNVGIGTPNPIQRLQVNTTPNAVVVTTGGNVGIGTTSPPKRLSIFNDVPDHDGAQIMLRSASDNWAQILFARESDNGGWLVGKDDATSFKIRQLGVADRLTITTAGNLGVGTTAPSTKLDVAGTVSATAFSGDGSALTNVPGASLVYGADASAADDSVFVSSNGNVGIGTTEPMYKMHVYGSGEGGVVLRVGDTGGPKLQLSDEIDFADYIQVDETGHYMAFGQYDTQPVLVHKSGKIGIGITNPNVTLHVTGNTTIDGESSVIRINSVSAADADNAGIYFGGMSNDESAWDSAKIKLFKENVDDAELRIEIADNSGDTIYIGGQKGSLGADGMTIKHGGNVGIGTTNPQNKLHISAQYPYLQYTDTDGGSIWTAGVHGGGFGYNIREGNNDPRLVIKEGGNIGIGVLTPNARLEVGGTVSANAFIKDGVAIAGDGHSLDASDGSPADALYVDINGYVGIGTTGPSRELEVNGMIRAEGMIVSYNSNYADIHLNSNGSEDWLIRNHNSNRLQFTPFTTQGDLPAMVIENTGYVGIGDGGPDAQLEVNGTSSGNAAFQVKGKGYDGVLREGIYVNASGNVSIGTTAPGTKLYVRGDDPDLALDMDSSSSSDLIELRFNVDGQDQARVQYKRALNNLDLLWDRYGTGSGDLSFTKYNATAMIVKNSGNVGIGMASPNAKLDVAGTVSANAFVGDGSGLSNVPGASTAYGAHASADDNSVYITSTEKVGIGTTAPAARLDIKGLDNTADGGLIVRGADGSRTARLWVDGANSLAHLTAGDGTVDLIINHAGGNVGIGATSPTAKLDIKSESDIKLAMRDEAGTYKFIQNGTLFGIQDHIGYRMIMEPGITNINTGNVGIGTSSPAAKLDVNGQTVLRDRTVIGSNIAAASTELYVKSGADDYNVVTIEGTTNQSSNTYLLNLRRGGTTDGTFVVKGDSGNVGIGTTNPGAKLEVTGQYYSTMQTAATTIDWADGNVQDLTLGATNTIAWSNMKGGAIYTLYLHQDATGSRTVTWPATAKWPGGVEPVLTTTASALDIFTFTSDGTNLYNIGYASDIK
ncbi:MAG: hypothetical protein ABIH39_01510 [Candidatus Margulisiibacteriota bacterium]